MTVNGEVTQFVVPTPDAGVLSIICHQKMKYIRLRFLYDKEIAAKKAVSCTLGNDFFISLIVWIL